MKSVRFRASLFFERQINVYLLNTVESHNMRIINILSQKRTIRSSLSILMIGFLAACDLGSSSSSESDVERNARETTERRESGEFWDRYYNVKFVVANNSGVDARVRVRGPDGQHEVLVQANQQSTLWANRRPRGDTIYLEVWHPRFNQWMKEDAVTLYDRDVNRTVNITRHTYGGL